MTEIVLREFTCKYCDHCVVVHPDFPSDETPTVCTPCWERVVKPEQDRHTIELMEGLMEFMEFLLDKRDNCPTIDRINKRQSGSLGVQENGQ